MKEKGFTSLNAFSAAQKVVFESLPANQGVRQTFFGKHIFFPKRLDNFHPGTVCL